MAAWLRVIVGLVLLAHGLVHLLYLIPTPDDPKFPFTLRDSWLAPESVRRPLALALIAGTVAAFALLALAAWGVPGLSSVWPAIAILGSALSLAVLVTFWDAQLVFGTLLDVALIAVAVIRPEWTDRIGG